MDHEINSTVELVSLFLFAHQDDEFGVFQKIVEDHKKGYRVCCAYITDGAFNGCSSKRRNQESLAVLSRLGVSEQDVVFVGDLLSIPDAALSENLEKAAVWISEWIFRFSHVKSICTPAWEGGHHDHDALHAITVCVTNKLGLLSYVRQFSLYNNYGCFGPFFNVLKPLLMNGESEEIRIPWGNRFLFLRNCLGYPSQAITWLGIFPFVLFSYLTTGVQVLQLVSLERIRFRPHEGELYYERRGFYTWKKMVDNLTHWQSRTSLYDNHN